MPSARSEVDAAGPRVEDVVWLCPAVRAGVRGIVRGRVCVFCDVSGGCCSVEVFKSNSHVRGLYKNALCLYEFCQTGKIALLSPQEKLRPSFS